MKGSNNSTQYRDGVTKSGDFNKQITPPKPSPPPQNNTNKGK